MSKLTKVEIRMKTENLIGAVKKLREVKEIIVDVKNADENVYFSTPETERDEKDYLRKEKNHAIKHRQTALRNR